MRCIFKPRGNDLYESTANVIIISLLFHALFFAWVLLMTKALYRSHEFDRPPTFELVKLSQGHDVPAEPAQAPAAAPNRKTARPPENASVSPVTAPRPVAEKKTAPGEQKIMPGPQASSSAPAPQEQDATSGPSPDNALELDKVYDADAVDELPVAIKKPDPFYPEFLKDQGISGTVKAQIVIDRSGNVIEIKILSSPHELLSDEVVKAVSRWKYKPGKFRGLAVKVKSRDVEVVFQLTD